jgi:ubiquinone/menaquinone biosynthesis C-methylase UbiE
MDTALEIGGGTLVYSTMLAGTAKRYLTLDLADSHDMNPHDRFKLPNSLGVDNIHPIAARGERIPLQPESVDLIFTSNVFEHLEDQQATVDEMVRVLRPGGVVVSVVAIPWSRVNYFMEHLIMLVPRLALRVGRLIGKRWLGTSYVEYENSLAQAATAERLQEVQRGNLISLLAKGFWDSVTFKTHGEHYASNWEEIMNYRLSVYRGLYSNHPMDVDKVFTNRLNWEWFGADINSWLYKLLGPVNRMVGSTWPFYLLGHEAVVVHWKRDE